MEKNECVDGLKNLISQNLFMSLIPISNENFVYEERVQLNCFYCSRYNTKWTCPPKIPPINYKRIISEYNNLLVLKYERKFQKEDFDVVRNESTNEIHRALLQMENFYIPIIIVWLFHLLVVHVSYVKMVAEKNGAIILEWLGYRWKQQELML